MKPDPGGPDPGERVLVVSGTRSCSTMDWLAVADVAALAGTIEAPRALVLDIRAHGFLICTREAKVLATGLSAYPVVAILTDSGASYECARATCALVQLRGSVAAAFHDEAQAWQWLSAKLGTDLHGGASARKMKVGC